jgi:transposase
VCSVIVQYTIEQHVFLYDSYLKCGSARKCRQKFQLKFYHEIVCSWQTVHNLVNKLRSTGLLTEKKQKHKRRVLTEENLRLEHMPIKSLKSLAQETGVWKSTTRWATQLLKLRPYKATVIHAFQLCNPAGRVYFCSWFLQSVIEGEIDPQLTLFSGEAWFHLQGYRNT